MKHIKLLLLVLFTVYSSTALAVPSLKFGSGGWDTASDIDPIRARMAIMYKHHRVNFKLFIEPSKKFKVRSKKWSWGKKWSWRDKSNGLVIKHVGSLDQDDKKYVDPDPVDPDPKVDVPEPSIVGLLAIGLLGIVVVRRRLMHK